MRLLRCLALVIALAVSVPPAARATDDPPFAGKRLLHIDSYHAGNEWNDRIRAALTATLAGSGIEEQVFFMDAKRHPSDADNQAAALRAKAMIEAFRPDIVTASDDNAAKYVIAPYYKDAPLPIVFCGVNWDASVYGLPYSNTTGMVEVSSIPQIVNLLRQYAHGERLGYIAEDTLSKRKETEFHRKLFGVVYDKVYLVSTFADWLAAFRRAQSEVDMLMVLGVGAVADWNEAEARAVAESETRIPAGTDFDWLAGVTLIAVSKLPEEQGRWTGQAALKILGGVPPSRIPVTYNKEGKLYFNPRIAARLGVDQAPPLAELVR